jgi:hypothetical protein
MSAPEYPIGTLLEMAAIPDEAMPRFLAELPTILAETRQYAEVLATIGEMVGGAGKVTARPKWVDDDLDQLTRSITLGETVLATLTTPRPDAAA